MKSVLITGCNGTVGRYVTRKLLGAGYRVLGISLEPAPHARHENLNYRCVDVTNTEAIAEVLRLERPEALVHLAAIVHVRNAQLSFADYCHVNYYASKRLFELAAANGIKRVVFASTIEVYGPTPDQTPIAEDFPCRPDSDYARTKLLAESALTEVGSQCHMATATLRLAPVYAPDFRLNLDKRLYLRPGIGYSVGRGDYCIDLCSVHNIDYFILRWLAQDDFSTGIYNLCDERSYAIADLLARESRSGRSRVNLRIPFWPAVAAAAMLETSLNLLGRSAGMYTADNVRKLVRSTHWDTRKAVSAVGPLPWNMDNTMDQTL